MKLSPQEKKFVKDMANIWSDQRIADELSRIRTELELKDRVTIDQVRKARYRSGITKLGGRGKCQVKHKENNNE